MNKKRRFLSYALIGIVGLCLVFAGLGLGIRQVINAMTASPLRKALPSTAQDIHESAWEEGGDTGQDYCYLLRAKITPAEFQQYVNKLNLTLHTPTRQYSNGFSPNWSISCGIGKKPDWWTPLNDSSGTYVREGNSAWTYAKYENGYIFVVSYNI